MADNNGNETVGTKIRKAEQGCKAPVIDVTCGKCGAKLRFHAPVIVKKVDFFVTTIVISPTYSLDERICPGCGTAYAPDVSHLPVIGWSAVQPPEHKEPSRIIMPGMGLPPGWDPRG